MKIGELFIELGVIGDTQKLKEAEKDLKNAERQSSRLIKYRKDLAKATSDEEKALIKKNFAQQVELDKTQQAIEKNQGHAKSIKGVVNSFTALVAGVSIAVGALDRIINATAKANQQMITLSHTSGISLASFNKYASASASVNYNSTPEQVAQSMQNVASNLWDIRMGRGDISPYQELSFVGGKAFSPFGMNVEQVIEQVRESIKGVNDLQATNIITRMGFSPDDLLMLRMSKKEFQEIQNLFMSPKQQEQMNKYALQLKKVHLQFDLLKNQILLKIMPPFIQFMKHVENVAEVWAKVVANISEFIKVSQGAKLAIAGLAGAFTFAFAKAHPLLMALTAIYLLLEDFAFYKMGYGSVIGDVINGFNDFMDEQKKNNTALGRMFNWENQPKEVKNIYNMPSIDKENGLLNKLTALIEMIGKLAMAIGQTSGAGYNPVVQQKQDNIDGKTIGQAVNINNDDLKVFLSSLDKKEENKPLNDILEAYHNLTNLQLNRNKKENETNPIDLNNGILTAYNNNGLTPNYTNMYNNSSTNNNNFNQTNNMTINTTQPADQVAMNKISEYTAIIGRNIVYTV